MPPRRRTRGSGTVYWSESRGKWIAEKTVGYTSRGKRILRKGSGNSDSAALRKLNQRVKDYEAGLLVRSEHYKVSQAVEDWLTHGQGDVEETTKNRNRSLCQTHIVPKLGGRKLRELTPAEVDNWLVDRSKVLATSTLTRVKWCLKSAVARAMKRGFVDRNVVDLCETPRGKAGRRSKSLTLDQAKAVLTTTRKDPLHCYLVVSLLTGARTEEMRALTWGHVHLDGDIPYVEVWRSVRKTGDTKTRRSRRTLALPALAAARLRDHRESAQTLGANSALVFPSETGTVMDASNLRRTFRRALESVEGIEADEWTPRELRHSFVSLLSDLGISIDEISQLVGHRGTQVTELVYRHQLKPVLQLGAAAMDTLFPDEDTQDDKTQDDQK